MDVALHLETRDDYSQGFNAINATELPGALESNLTYYQVVSSCAVSDTEWMRAQKLLVGVEQ